MTEITKNMKAGYQGKPDAMRMKAEKLLNHPGKADDGSVRHHKEPALRSPRDRINTQH